jgi:lipopolysaccharide/colanic/teichoic acid biosynthesis glycosyltransferase
MMLSNTMSVDTEVEQEICSTDKSLKLLLAFQSVPGLCGWRCSAKRAADFLVSLIVLPLMLPLWLLICIAIKVESKGATLFRQTRIGKGGKPFVMYKFRSMYEGAEDVLESLTDLNEADGPVFKIKGDPRITRVGSILRRSSLDEVPQFINVLKGEMSLVGPRPPLPNEVAKYNERQWQRLAVKPGLTCLWQTQGRSRLPFDRWIELDLDYVYNQSLWLDFKILMRTVPAVLKGNGAW